MTMHRFIVATLKIFQELAMEELFIIPKTQNFLLNYVLLTIALVQVVVAQFSQELLVNVLLHFHADVNAQHKQALTVSSAMFGLVMERQIRIISSIHLLH